MILTKSIKVHAVDKEKNAALCGHAVYLKPEQKTEGSYLEVNCKSCQWIIETELKSRYGA